MMIEQLKDEKILEKAEQLSDRMQAVIEQSVDTNINNLKKSYWDKLIIRKLAIPTSSGMQLKRQQLKEAFRDFFSQQLLELMSIDLDVCIDMTLRNYRRGDHPLYHILMQLFLEMNLEEVERCKSYSIDEIKPNILCYCLNPLSAHKGRHRIDNIKTHYSSQTGKYMCTCACSCGFVFTTNLDDVNESKGTKIGRIECYGEEYQENLIKLMPQGIKGVARYTGLNLGTIRRQFRRYNKYGDIRSEREKHYSEETKRVHIKRVHIKAKSIRKENFWEKKDMQYSALAKELIDRELISEEKPVRITKTRIGREIGAVHAVVYCLDKLPKTKAIIEQYQESRDDILVRKVKWAMAKLEECGKNIKKWRVMDIAGFCDENVVKVEKVIEKIQKIQYE